MVALQWIPSHCDLKGNEKADMLSKAGSRLEQTRHPISYMEAKTLIRAKYHQKWKDEHEPANEHDCLQDLNRWQQTTIFRLRTGHCLLLSHLYRLKLAQTNECPCGTGIQDPTHILQNCPLLTPERTSLWPNGAEMQEKLWGGLNDLKKTALFIRNTNIPI